MVAVLFIVKNDDFKDGSCRDVYEFQDWDSAVKFINKMWWYKVKSSIKLDVEIVESNTYLDNSIGVVTWADNHMQKWVAIKSVDGNHFSEAFFEEEI